MSADDSLDRGAGSSPRRYPSRPVVEVFDRITMDDDQRVRYHFVLVDRCLIGEFASR